MFTGVTLLLGSAGINSVLRAGPSFALNGIALLNLVGGIGEVEFKGGGEPAPNPKAGGGGGGAVIVPEEGDKGIELPGNGGRPPVFIGMGGAIAGRPIGIGGAIGSGVPELGRAGTPKGGGGGVPIGAGGGGGTIAGMPELGVLGSGGIPPKDGGGGVPIGAGGGAIGAMVGADPGRGGNSVLMFSPGKGGRPSLFPARSGTGGMAGTPGIVLGSIAGAPLVSSAVVSLISLPGTGTKSIFAGVVTGRMPPVMGVFFGSTAATTASVVSFAVVGSIYFLIITADSRPTNDAVTTSPAFVSRFIEPTPYKLGGQMSAEPTLPFNYV